MKVGWPISVFILWKGTLYPFIFQIVYYRTPRPSQMGPMALTGVVQWAGHRSADRQAVGQLPGWGV